jgi:hypothetical protein
VKKRLCGGAANTEGLAHAATFGVQSFNPAPLQTTMVTPAALNGDGSLVVGNTDHGTLRWSAAAAYVNLTEYLIAAGIDLIGRSLDSAVDLGDDGTRIFGHGCDKGQDPPSLG